MPYYGNRSEKTGVSVYAALKYYEPPWEDRTQGKECHIQDSGALGSGIKIIIIHNKRRSHVHLTEQTGSNNALQIEARASLRDSSHPMPNHILCDYQSEDTDTVSPIIH